MLVPVTQNSDGTLTITGDAINLPSHEAEKLLRADTNGERLRGDQVIKVENTVHMGTCSDQKDLYDEPAKTPTDIIALDTNIPITDQVAYQSSDPELHQPPTVVIDSGLGYQTEFSNVEVNVMQTDKHFESIRTEESGNIIMGSPTLGPFVADSEAQSSTIADSNKTVITETDHRCFKQCSYFTV